LKSQIKQNYSLILEQTIKENEKAGLRPTLLLHACCAPCSSYVLEYLSKHFDITLLFYNPNISPEEEYIFRENELRRLIGEMPLPKGITVISEKYVPEEFYDIAKGLEHLSEGGERCKKCYRLRLSRTAEIAKEKEFDYFTTTLSISPYKNAEWLNSIGEEEGSRFGVKYLFSDFKKKNGYKRSCELSAEYGLYRQSYCGCEFSKQRISRHDA
jgi:predicted adenine nucleotide alpha hydrolase (AANH) superfamily ATPase